MLLLDVCDIVAVTVGIEGSEAIEGVAAMEVDEEPEERMATAARAVGRTVAEEEEDVVWVDAESAAVFVVLG